MRATCRPQPIVCSWSPPPGDGRGGRDRAVRRHRHHHVHRDVGAADASSSPIPKTKNRKAGSATMKNIPTRSRSWRLRSRPAYVARAGRGARSWRGSCSWRSGVLRSARWWWRPHRVVAGQGQERGLEAGAGTSSRGRRAGRRPADRASHAWSTPSAPTTSAGGRKDTLRRRTPRAPRRSDRRPRSGRGPSAPCGRRTRRPRRGSGWRRRWCGPRGVGAHGVPELLARAHVHAGGRLVEDHQVGVGDQRQGELQPLLLASRAGLHAPVGDRASPARSTTTSTRSRRPCSAAIARTVSRP